MAYKPRPLTNPPTWIRVEDESGQFDHRADLPLPAGQSVVEGYPEHVAFNSRAPKARVEIKSDRQVLKDLAKDLDVTVGSKSDQQLTEDIRAAQAEVAAQQPANEVEARQQAADAESGSSNDASAAGEGSE